MAEKESGSFGVVIFAVLLLAGGVVGVALAIYGYFLAPEPTRAEYESWQEQCQTAELSRLERANCLNTSFAEYQQIVADLPFALPFSIGPALLWAAIGLFFLGVGGFILLCEVGFLEPEEDPLIHLVRWLGEVQKRHPVVMTAVYVVSTGFLTLIFDAIFEWRAGNHSAWVTSPLVDGEIFVPGIVFAAAYAVFLVGGIVALAYDAVSETSLAQ